MFPRLLIPLLGGRKEHGDDVRFRIQKTPATRQCISPQKPLDKDGNLCHKDCRPGHSALRDRREIRSRILRQAAGARRPVGNGKTATGKALWITTVKPF